MLVPASTPCVRSAVRVLEALARCRAIEPSLVACLRGADKQEVERAIANRAKQSQALTDTVFRRSHATSWVADEACAMMYAASVGNVRGIEAHATLALSFAGPAMSAGERARVRAEIGASCLTAVTDVGA